jgi:hypothetical protein
MSCDPCPKNSWCPGGLGASAQRTPCGPCLMTATTLAQNASACITQPGCGFNVASSTAAVCSLGTYSSGSSQQPCTPCPAGLTTLAASAKTIQECMAPPGYFFQVRWDACMRACTGTPRQPPQRCHSMLALRGGRRWSCMNASPRACPASVLRCLPTCTCTEHASAALSSRHVQERHGQGAHLLSLPTRPHNAGAHLRRALRLLAGRAWLPAAAAGRRGGWRTALPRGQLRPRRRAVHRVSRWPHDKGRGQHHARGLPRAARLWLLCRRHSGRQQRHQHGRSGRPQGAAVPHGHVQGAPGVVCAWCAGVQAGGVCCRACTRETTRLVACTLVVLHTLHAPCRTAGAWSPASPAAWACSPTPATLRALRSHPTIATWRRASAAWRTPRSSSSSPASATTVRVGVAHADCTARSHYGSMLPTRTLVPLPYCWQAPMAARRRRTAWSRALARCGAVGVGSQLACAVRPGP